MTVQLGVAGIFGTSTVMVLPETVGNPGIAQPNGETVTAGDPLTSVSPGGTASVMCISKASAVPVLVRVTVKILPGIGVMGPTDFCKATLGSTTRTLIALEVAIWVPLTDTLNVLGNVVPF